MRARDMDPRTLYALAEELEKDAAFWRRGEMGLGDEHITRRLDALARTYRRRARLAQRAQAKGARS